MRFLREVERWPSPRDAALALTPFYAGTRIAETIGLDIDDVALSARRGSLRIHGKGDQTRQVPIHPPLRAAFTDWLTERADKEKQVDVALSTTMMEDSFRFMKAANGDMAVLAAGDGDFLPTIESLQARSLRVKVVSWSHAVNRRLRDNADEFVELDSYFDQLTW